MEQMDIPRYLEFTEHWNEYPPVHVSVALYVFQGKAGRKQSAGAGMPVAKSQSAEAIVESLLSTEGTNR